MQNKEILEEIEREKNPLLAERKLENRITRDEWIRRVETEEQYKELLHLFHNGLDWDMVQGGGASQMDVLKKYFDGAHGYSNLDSFYHPHFHNERVQIPLNGKVREVSVCRAKMEVAQKAFSILCLKVLKDTQDENGFKKIRLKPSWWDIFPGNEDVFKRMLEFFSFAKNIPRKATSHTELIATDFLYKLATSAWNQVSEEMVSEAMVRNRDAFIEILWHLGELKFLSEYYMLLCREDIEKLEKLSESLKDYKNDPMSMEDAFLKGQGNGIVEYLFVIKQKIQLTGKEPPTRERVIRLFSR